MGDDRRNFDWRLKERRSAARCALCHGAYDEDDWLICKNCGTQGHGECLRAEGLCPTLGCQESHRPPKCPSPLNKRGRAVSLEALALDGMERELHGPQTVQQRILKQWKIRRLLSFLNLTVDDIVNDRAAKRRLFTYFKIQRQSERRGQKQLDEVDDDYNEWVRSQI